MLVRKHAGARNELIATAWLLDNGFEVFRNVSQCGIIDIVAIKDGVVHLFDVKGLSNPPRASAGNLSSAQVAAGVKRLNVYDGVTCEIINDTVIPITDRRKTGNCANCEGVFVITGKKNRFCSRKCANAFHTVKLRAERRDAKVPQIRSRKTWKKHYGKAPCGEIKFPLGEMGT